MKKIIFITILLLSSTSFADDKMMEENHGMMMEDKMAPENAMMEGNSIKNYSESEWKKASSNDGITVVQFHAGWCSTCRTQHKTIEEIVKENQFKDIKFFQVDFDKEKSLKQNLGVTQQSTIIVFKGTKEITRAIGDTSTSKITDLVMKAL